MIKDTSTQSCNETKSFNVEFGEQGTNEIDGGTQKNKYRSGLQAHINEVHLKLGESMCSHCGHKASRKSIIAKHIKFVHAKCEDFKCPDCGYLLYSALKLRNHKRNVHEMV